MKALPRVLLLVTYPVAIAVLTRWVPVVRQRRLRWFLAHQAAVAGITTGWALRGQPVAAAVNGSWLALAAAWYGLGSSEQWRQSGQQSGY